MRFTAFNIVKKRLKSCDLVVGVIAYRLIFFVLSHKMLHQNEFQDKKKGAESKHLKK